MCMGGAESRIFANELLPRLPGSAYQPAAKLTQLIVRSPFRVKHHVVVQYMARWMKCPLPPPPFTPLPLPQPPSPLLDPPAEDKEEKEESVTLLVRDFALQLP